MRYLTATLAALALVCGLYGAFKHREVQTLTGERDRALEAVRTLEDVRERDKRALSLKQKQIVALKQQKEKQDAKLEAALAASPDWADQRVPDGVLDALGVRRYHED